LTRQRRLHSIAVDGLVGKQVGDQSIEGLAVSAEELSGPLQVFQQATQPRMRVVTLAAVAAALAIEIQRASSGR